MWQTPPLFLIRGGFSTISRGVDSKRVEPTMFTACQSGGPRVEDGEVIEG